MYFNVVPTSPVKSAIKAIWGMYRPSHSPSLVGSVTYLEPQWRPSVGYLVGWSVSKRAKIYTFSKWELVYSIYSHAYSLILAINCPYIIVLICIIELFTLRTVSSTKLSLYHCPPCIVFVLCTLLLICQQIHIIFEKWPNTTIT